MYPIFIKSVGSCQCPCLVSVRFVVPVGDDQKRHKGKTMFEIGDKVKGYDRYIGTGTSSYKEEVLFEHE